MAQHTPARTLKQQTSLVLGSVKVRQASDATAIAQACLDADRRGDNGSVWHQAALFYGVKCNCTPCVAKVDGRS